MRMDLSPVKWWSEPSPARHSGINKSTRWAKTIWRRTPRCGGWLTDASMSDGPSIPERNPRRARRRHDVARLGLHQLRLAERLGDRDAFEARRPERDHLPPALVRHRSDGRAAES